jgi:hypothetical protein
MVDHVEPGPAMTLEAASAAMLGFAIGTAALVVVGSSYVAAAGALLAAVAAFACLQGLAEPAHFEIGQFDAPATEAGDFVQTLSKPVLPELLLIEPIHAELLLTDPLPAPNGERSLDGRLGTPGELQLQIERHLKIASRKRTEPSLPISDDSAALHEALAALKHSLR